MEKETVILETPIRYGSLTVSVVARIRLGSWRYAACGMKQPIAVVVSSATQKKAFRVKTGEATTLEQLMGEFPAIKDGLEKLSRS